MGAVSEAPAAMSIAAASAAGIRDMCHIAVLMMSHCRHGSLYI
jgi:hypothetical protein